MREVGAFEAKTKLAALLDLVEGGEDVLITRRGRAVARLTAPNARFDRERAWGAAARIRARRRGMTLGNLTIEELVNEGCR